MKPLQNSRIFAQNIRQRPLLFKIYVNYITRIKQCQIQSDSVSY